MFRSDYLRLMGECSTLDSLLYRMNESSDEKEIMRLYIQSLETLKNIYKCNINKLDVN